MSKIEKREEPIEGELDAEDLSKVSGGILLAQPTFTLVPMYNPKTFLGTASLTDGTGDTSSQMESTTNS